MRNEPRTRLEVESARAWSTPRSVFLGRVVDPGEATWTVADRRWAMALTQLERDTHSCGHLMSESFDPDTQFDWETTAQRCFACASASKEAAHFNQLAAETPPGADVSGLFYSTSRRSDRL